MESVYEAANALEAHMISNLLESEGVSNWIQGEHLMGGVGELQTFGLVNIAVNHDDVPRARQIIRDWESQEETVTGSRSDNNNSRLAYFIAGFVTATLIALILR